MLGRFVLVYLDDIVIFSRTGKEHLQLWLPKLLLDVALRLHSHNCLQSITCVAGLLIDHVAKALVRQTMLIPLVVPPGRST